MIFGFIIYISQCRYDGGLLMVNKYRLISLCVCVVIFSACSKEKTYQVDIRNDVRSVHNIGPTMDSPLAKLEFVRKIGEMEPDNEKYMFQRPISVDRDENGFLYVLDIDANLIKKFDREGRYVSEFGRSGQGPGEFEYPQNLSIGGEGKLLVATMNSLYHLFDLDGAYIDRVRMPLYQGLFMKMMRSSSFVGYSMEPNGENSPENKIFNIYDLEGNVTAAFGIPFLVDNVRSSWVANFPSISVDKEDSIFVNFTAQNRIEKYSNNGTLLLSISRDLPFPLKYGYKKEMMEIMGEAREIDREDFPKVGRGIGVDPRGMIWVMTYKKPFPEDFKPEDFIHQDFLHFEIFSDEGILLFRLTLPEILKRFDNWTIIDDSLYFVDPQEECCIHEYRIIEN